MGLFFLWLTFSFVGRFILIATHLGQKGRDPLAQTSLLIGLILYFLLGLFALSGLFWSGYHLLRKSRKVSEDEN